VTPGDDPHLAAFRLHLRQQRCHLLRRPLTAALNPRNDLYICQSGLYLELPKATPADANLGDSGRDFYTQLTGRLQKGSGNLGFSRHKKVKGDEVVAFCDRHCNAIALFVTRPGWSDPGDTKST
jgi:hypothetical protein